MGLKTVTYFKRLPYIYIFGFVSLSYCPLVSESTYLHAQHGLSAENVGSISACQCLSGRITSKILFKTKIWIVMILEYIYIYWNHDYFIFLS